jgi:DNA polymerase I-like protein with 3'-5' exonuclease and polymerase domains
MTVFSSIDELATLTNALTIAFDCETTQLQPELGKMRLLQFAALDRHPIVLDCWELDDDGWEKIAAFFATKRYWIAHNAVFDTAWLQEYGIYPNGPIQCSLLASRLLTNGLPNLKHGLQHVVKRYLKFDLSKEEQKSDWSGYLTPSQLAYAADDVRVLTILDGPLNQLLACANLHIAWRAECDAIPAMAQLWRTGLPFDRVMLNTLNIELEQECTALNIQLIIDLDNALPSDYKLPRDPDGTLNIRTKATGTIKKGNRMPAGFNINSPMQLSRAFAALLGEYPVDSNGKVSVARDALRQYAADHPVIALYLQWKRIEKRRQMVNTLIGALADDGRIRASYMQLGADTGRMSCIQPNLQQIPRDQNFRACVQAPEGKLLVVADFAQMELKLAAAEANDQVMIDAFKNNLDLHTLTAMEIYDIPEEAVTKEQRQVAKSANFGLLFGSGAKGLREYAGSMGIQMDIKEAQEIRETFHRVYPGIHKWQMECAKQADIAYDQPSIRIRHSKMRRFLIGDNNKLTTRCNTPIQGAGAAVMKKALVYLWQELEQVNEDEAKLAGVVHDEIILEVKEGAEEKWAEILKTAMETAEALWLGDIPALAEVKWAKSWAQAK